MRITRIESQKRRPGRKNIYVDGHFFAGVSAETVVRLGLRTGDTLGPAEWQTVTQTEQLVSAKNVALRILSVRPRTIQEVRRRLQRKGFSADQVERVIDDMRASGLLDDEAFARLYIRNVLALKPAGPSLLRHKLRFLGLDPELLERSLQEVFADIDLEAEAEKAAHQYLNRSPLHRAPDDDSGLRRRTSAFLLRRGFPWELIQSLLPRLLTSRQGEDDEPGRV